MIAMKQFTRRSVLKNETKPSYRKTSENLGERESASVSTPFQVLPNFHECFHNVLKQGGVHGVTF